MGDARSQAGFTLIEIMVVVFILGLLTTLVAPRIIERGVEAKRTVAAADIKAVSEQLRLYKLDNGAYPSGGDGLQALVACPPSARNCNPEGYLPKVPVDPWGNPYAYFTDGTRFLVKSYAADGREGGDGYNADIVSDDA